jgi:biotin carboxyl carrier protein
VKPGTFVVRHRGDVYRAVVEHATAATGGSSASSDVRVENPPLTPRASHPARDSSFTVVAESPSEFRVHDGDRTRSVFITEAGRTRQAFVDGEVYEFEVEAEAAAPPRFARSAPDVLAAPMPARVVAVAVNAGDRVRKGDVVITLEAMKMELPVRSPRDGVVGSIACRVGDLVQPGVSLMEVV